MDDFLGRDVTTRPTFIEKRFPTLHPLLALKTDLFTTLYVKQLCKKKSLYENRSQKNSLEMKGKDIKSMRMITFSALLCALFSRGKNYYPYTCRFDIGVSWQNDLNLHNYFKDSDALFHRKNFCAQPQFRIKFSAKRSYAL